MKINDATEGNNNGRPGTSMPDDTPFDFSDNPIADLVSEGDHEEPAGDKKDEGGDKKDAPISPELQARLDKMDEAREEDRQTIQFLKGQNSILETQLRGGNKEEPSKQEPLIKVPDKAQLQKMLADPDTAVDSLLGLFTEFGNSIIDRINKVDETSKVEHSRRDQHARWQSAMARDRQEAIDEFGEDTLNDKAFIAEADKELEKVIAGRGGKSLQDVLPGDFSAVAARVYNRWLRQGKISIEGKATNGNAGDTRENRRPTLREISREVSSSDRMGSNGGPRNSGGGAKSIADLGMSPRDTRIAQAAAKRMGVSEEAWVRNYNAGQAEDEGYGR